MYVLKFLAYVSVAASLSACGTYVPSFQQFPRGKAAEQQLVQAIVQNVTCEARDAVNKLYNKLHTNNLFLNNWGAQIALNLSIEEKQT